MRLTLIALAASLAAAGLPARAQGSDAPLRALIDQGQYWQAHRRGDLAEQAWQKVLRIDPRQADALFGMGMARADVNDGAGARQYLARLREAAPNDPRVDTLSARLGENTPRDTSLSVARQYAQAGQSASAVAAYQQALSGKPATPELQLEYYQALAATPQGWDQARRGLEQLAHDHPNDPRYALALAQHLSYRDATRRDAIARLASLANDPTYGADARKSWRQALLWLGARPSDGPLFQAYLNTAPDDAAVKARYDGMVQQDQAARANAQVNAARSAQGRLIADGFAALDNNDLATAGGDFQRVLNSSPNEPNALGGMGIVALKQERFDAARDYLERASRGSDAGRWKQALTSARYWSDTSAAIGARSNGDNAKAKQLLERAIETDPSDVTAQVLLGETLLDAHDPTGAEAAYRMALRRQADNPDAIRGMVGALAAQGRGNEALQFADALTAEQQAKAGGLNALRATALIAQGRIAEAQGDLGSARSLFEDALIGRPDDPWLRLDLAHIYMRQGALGSARGMMDGLIAAHPDMPDALYAGALLAADMQDWQDGLQLLERIPAAQRSAAMTTLQHRLWVHLQAGYALQFVRAGQFQQAYSILYATQPTAGNNPELIGALADVYVQAGDPYRALTLMRTALANTPDDPGTLLQFASILQSTHQDAELGAVMRRLSGMQLTPDQREQFARLNLGIVVAQADAIRKRGDLAGAYDVLAPWLAVLPENPQLQGMLGRLYTSAGESAEALKCYRLALSKQPDDRGLQINTIYAAATAKDFSFGEQVATSALRTAPNDPDLLTAAGRLYRAEGRVSLAADYLRRALLVSTLPAGARLTPSGVPTGWQAAFARMDATTLPGANPFAGKTAVDVPAAPLIPSTQSTVPSYLPPAPAALYSAPAAPYAAPNSVPYSAPYAAPALTPYPAPARPALPPSSSLGYGAPRADDDRAALAYGPADDGASEAADQPLADAATPEWQRPLLPHSSTLGYSAWQDGTGNSDDTGSAYGSADDGTSQAGGGAPYAPALADAGGYPQTQANGYAAPAQTAAPGAAYAAPASAGYAAPAQTAYPNAAYAAPAQSAYPNAAYAAPAQPAYPNAAYAAPAQSAYPNAAYAAPAQSAYPNAAYAAPAQSAYPNAAYAAPAQSAYPNAAYAAPAQSAYPNPYAAPPPAQNVYTAAPQGYGYAQQGYAAPADSPWPSAAPTQYAAAVTPLPANPPRAATKKRSVSHTARTVRRAPVYAQRTYQQSAPLPYAPQQYQQPVYQQPYVPQPPAVYAAPVYAPQAVPPATQQTLSVAQELAALDQAQSSSVTGGIFLRNRAGEDGLSNLNDIEAPLQGRVAAGNGHIVVTATPVTLDAGTSDGDTFSYTPAASTSSTGTSSGNELTRARFGSGLTSLYPCAPVDVCSYKYSSFGSQTATGVGLQLGYETQNVQANVGVTPLGFAETNVLGGLKYSNGITDKVSYSLAVTRQAVTDSLLSYAGARDASTGLKWGGVVSNNVHGDLGWDDGTNGVYLNAQFMYLDGDHVERNYGVKGGGGVYTRLWHDADHAFTVGLNTTLMGYDKNQSYFTYGQGGYFSPQQYVILNLPVELSGRDGPFTYDLKGSIGLQHYHEKSAQYFPLDPNLQDIAAQWGNTASLTGGSLDANGVYPAQSKSGVSYSLLANAEYQLSQQLTVGATASFGNAYEYREWLAAIYVRYNFTPQSAPLSFPPVGFNSPYLGN